MNTLVKKKKEKKVEAFQMSLESVLTNSLITHSQPWPLLGYNHC